MTSSFKLFRKLSSNMNIVIYQSFIIHIFVLFYDSHTLSVVMKGSEVGLLGANGTEIECLCTQDNDSQILVVTFMAFNRNSKTIEQIATYRPDETPQLTDNGQYLNGRVILMTITKLSKQTVMKFNKLICIDDTFYQCKVTYLDSRGTHNPISNNISISVQVPPSKPDSVLLVHTPADSSVTTAKQMNYRSSSPSTAVTSNENETVSAPQTEKQNATTAFNHSTKQTPGHNTTTSTPSHEDRSTNSRSYRTTTYSIQLTTTVVEIAEGDNITVVCTGDVGNPPVEHVFQKYINGKIVPMKDTVTTTSIHDMPENCSYYRTSNLTFQVTAKDNNSVIRCVVNSSMVELDMYVETTPIQVYYKVRMPTIQLYPNKTDYVVGLYSSIDLICKSDGNPKPNYHWYKENHNMPISNSENFTITDMNKTDSGMYTCNVSNTFNGGTYNNATNVRVNIIYEADISTTHSSSTGSSSGADDKKKNSIERRDTILYGFLAVVGVVLITVITFCVYKRRNTSEVLACEQKSKSLVGSSPKPVSKPRTGDYDDICLDEDANKKPTINNVHKVEDIREHNKEYLRKQEEDEQKKNESNKPPQPAVYAQVNEATKSRNKQNTQTLANEYEEGTYAETQEGIYDKAGDRRHKENENEEHFDTSNNSSKGDTKSSIQSSQIGSYDNQAFQKNEDRKVATVSPQFRSSGASQDDKQKGQTRDIQSKKGYENVNDTNQTGTSEEVTSHHTAL